MRNQHHAIIVSGAGAQWRWLVIDPVGEAASEGNAPTQGEAMKSAWAVARSMNDEITQQRPPSGHSSEAWAL